MELRGKVVKVLPLAQGESSKGTWKRATVVIEYTDGKYPATLALDNVTDADSFAALQVGDFVNVRFAVSSREYNGKWYTSAKCFWFAKDIGQTTAQSPAPAKDDLPF